MDSCFPGLHFFLVFGVLFQPGGLYQMVYICVNALPLFRSLAAAIGLTGYAACMNRTISIIQHVNYARNNSSCFFRP